MRISRLRLAFDSSVPNYPTVRVLVDEQESLRRDGEERNDPAALLDTGSLLPQEPPRRIAFYGCGCGEFGCSCVAGLISEERGLVHWTDFRTITGIYHEALPPEGEGPDPVVGAEWTRPLPLPDLAFEAEQYHRAVASATADRSWETRPRAVIRLMREQRPTWPHWVARHGDRITVHHRVDDRASSTDLDLPAGPVQHLADSLVRLLDQYDVREIAELDLWR